MKLARRHTLLLGLALVLTSVMAACGGGGPQEMKFELEIRELSLVQEESVLRVHQGDMVTMVITADEHIGFHLHGYDLELEVEPGEPVTLEFTADATGSFSFTIHVKDEGHAEEADHDEEGEEDETELGRLEVQPR